MLVLLLTIAASLAALAGGFTALKSRHWLNQALALSSGLVLGLVTFDLLPEIFDISSGRHLSPVWPMIALTAGFLAFHIFERSIPMHASDEEEYGPHRHPKLGVARAIALTGHSFLDGLSIGVAFQVNNKVGAAVALAVIGHRFADGFDTATFMQFNKNRPKYIRRWLMLVVIMPVIGGLLSLVYTFSEKALAIYLGFFAGFILYICAGNILPQAHSSKSARRSILLTISGAIFMLIVTRFV